MKRELLMILACSGCVLNTNIPTERSFIDDGAVRVVPQRLALDDGVEATVLEDLYFDRPSALEAGGDYLPFDFAGHQLALEATQVANMAVAGGEVGLRIDGDYRIVSLSRREIAPLVPGTRNEVLEFDFSLNSRVVHATLEMQASYHCPPFPTEPATPEKSGPPAVAGDPL